ncbi:MULTISPECIES: N-acetyltransferase [Actinopolyspora]|uniref:Acetyltransferase (GNAT) family protein n=1 Tax=Actinopolyspora saharensis TaxID=995062 RepID=A0A1H0ZV02_9ACTN|nr:MULTISPECIES: N-acetyltransferase [Actinopolyspora]NHD15566.1 N-acetyltransferase [Actinopolyspora sp. BKK2]NHE75221.1 N-acetyltransferase [Actinopolyspora sp. BKK1]SDQ31248.1 Acetyltransferase (GNAT) family protein [Actinopolyspora saharensis]
MSESTASARLATAEDVEPAVRTLRRAFVDYPWTRHVIAADAHEERLAEFQRLFVSRIGLECGRVWVTPGCAAVSVWTTPDSTGIDEVFAELAPRFAELSGDRLEQSERAEAALNPHRPAEPVWFLGTVGVDPGSQGAGMAGAVIRPGLVEAERAGRPVYLETSQERNVRIYRRFGFEVVAEVEIPDDGPRTWAMMRRPGAGAP